MTVLSFAALAAAAKACSLLPAALAPIMVGIALHESGGDTNARHLNPNGTYDYGLAQINSSNLGWLRLTPLTVMDPCTNLAAGARVLFVRYNGNPPPEVAEAYANDVMAKISGNPAAGPSPLQPAAEDDPSDPRPPAWDMEAVADWRNRHNPSTQETADQGTPDVAVAQIIRKELK